MAEFLDCAWRALPHADGDHISGLEIARRLSNQQRAIRQNGLVMLHIPVNWNRAIIFGPLFEVEE